ncbi:hypothetical protein BDP55DRAFT_656662 [Colletotrichum godetiae]|uniref:Uncharacterized protein n=1 Tax=Colletotrichum godetiae TaxID=1209918 RepID=A0AAJ0AV35_9PEZI|nr:uncharacterized protein BDP55DRAFT_656662 [Colletotrichum godetiae]KAK1688654.1 hypothetical protein BDP55DRAFT_656662 [Colletotrichum godetiae]
MPTIASDLALFAQHIGPDLQDLRGYTDSITTLSSAAAAMSCPSRSRATGSTNPTTLQAASSMTTGKKLTTSFNRGFEQHLTDHAVHPISRSRKPELTDARAGPVVPKRSRLPPNFSDGAFETFQ